LTVGLGVVGLVFGAVWLITCWTLTTACEREKNRMYNK